MEQAPLGSLRSPTVTTYGRPRPYSQIVLLQINHDNRSESEDLGLSAGPFRFRIEFTFYSLESSCFNEPFISFPP
jgi:hypothetical protein